MLVNAVTGKGANGKKKKPPLGLDTHMLNNRTAAAAGLGKRGTDTKACLSQLTPRLAEGVGQSLCSATCLSCPSSNLYCVPFYHRQAGKLVRLVECAVPLTPDFYYCHTGGNQRHNKGWSARYLHFCARRQHEQIAGACAQRLWPTSGQERQLRGLRSAAHATDNLIRSLAI